MIEAKEDISKKLEGKRSPIAVFWEIISSESGLVGVILTYELGVGVLSLTVPIGVQTVVNTLAFAQLTQPLVFLAVAVLLGQFASAVLKATQIVILERLQKRLFAHTGMELAFRIPRMLRKSSSEVIELVNRFFDIVTIQKNLSFLLLEGFSLGLQILVGLVLLAFYHPALLAFDIILVIAILFVLFVVGRGAVKTSMKESYEKYNVVYWLEQIASKSIAFSSKSARDLALERADTVISSYLEARDSHFKIVFRQVIGFLSLHAIANTSLLVLGVILVSNNQLTIGQLVAAEIAVSTVMYSFSRFQKHLDNYYDLIAAIDKVGNLLDRPLEFHGPVVLDDLRTSKFEMREVEYAFPHSNKFLGPLNFTLHEKERVAIHGYNGSGKSTIVDLMYALKLPTSGYISFSGFDLRELDVEVLREKVALVRRVEIVRGSILENLKMGRKEIPQEKIHQVLDKLGLREEFISFPKGLQTELYEDGAPLSVSQAKRLMIARAMLSNPVVLLIDEITDELDDRSREKVMDAIFNKQNNWSVVITSKFPEVDSLCDRIIDMNSLLGK